MKPSNYVRIVYERLVQFFQTRIGLRLLKAGKLVIQVFILLVLTWQVLNIGWQSVVSNIPSQPLFYLIFLLMYFALPISEYFAYKFHWNISFWKSQVFFLEKRIYNKSFLGYSGEVQLFFRIKNLLGINQKHAYEVIRDNNLLSTLASTGFALLLITLFIITGKLTVFKWVDYESVIYIPLIITSITVGIIIFRKYRIYLFSMKRRQAIPVFLIHGGRVGLVTFLQVIQWYVVMPEVAFQVWFTIVALMLFISRIPFLPNKDLIFISASLELGQHIELSSAGLASILIMNNLLDKLLNLIVFSILFTRNRCIGNTSADASSTSVTS